MPIFGGHISIAGGVELAPGRGAALGLEAIQIFTKNQTRWEAPPLTDGSAALFRERRATLGIRRVASHGSYLVNLASPDPKNRRKGIEAFADDLHRCARLGIDQLIFHPGSPMGDGESAGIARVVEALDFLMEEHEGPRILLESTAGQGNNLGWRFEHLRDILAGCRDRKRLGVCLDTCHLFAAGFDLRTREGYESTFAAFDAVVGLQRLEAFHVNDSRGPLGSRVDRHETLGAGHIGASAFRRLVKDPRFDALPFYLETPGGEECYAENLAVLRGRRRRTTRA